MVSVVILSYAAVNGQTPKAPPSSVAGIPVNYDETLTGAHALDNLRPALDLPIYLPADFGACEN